RECHVELQFVGSCGEGERPTGRPGRGRGWQGGGAQPLTAPAVRPLIICFCRIRKTMSMGTAVRTVPASTGPQLVSPSLSCSCVRPIGSGATLSVSDIRNGHRYWFHSLTTVISVKAIRVGQDIGSTTRNRVRKKPVPSSSAAS